LSDVWHLFACSSHTTINPETGTSEEKKLFNLAHAKTGIVYEFEIYNNGFTEENWETVCNILQLAFYYTKHIGGKRRRGFGKVKFEIVNNNDGDLSKVFEDLKNVNRPSNFQKLENSNITKLVEEILNTNIDNESWQKAELFFYLDTPLALSERYGGVNHYECLNFIRGENILAVASKKLLDSGVKEDKILELFSKERIRFLPLKNYEIYETKVTPKCMFFCKDFDEGHTISFQFEDEPLKKCKKCNKPLKRAKGFIRKSLKWKNFFPQKYLRIMNKINFNNQTTSEENGLFSIEVLSKNNVNLRGEVYFKGDKVYDLLKEIFKERKICIGHGKTRGFGSGRLNIKNKKRTEYDFSFKGHSHLLIYLESDWAVAGYVHLNEELIKNLLAKELNLTPENIKNCWYSLKTLYGFNASKSLPKIPVLLVEAGSVFLIEIEDKDKGNLRNAYFNGIGALCECGYGSITIMDKKSFKQEFSDFEFEGKGTASNIEPVPTVKSLNLQISYEYKHKIQKALKNNLKYFPKSRHILHFVEKVKATSEKEQDLKSILKEEITKYEKRHEKNYSALWDLLKNLLFPAETKEHEENNEKLKNEMIAILEYIASMLKVYDY